jgi:hypothetical protein
MNEQQNGRRERLRALMDEYRCWPWDHANGPKHRDYDDTYAELAATYLGVEVQTTGDETPVEGGPGHVPRYASVSGDETYSMIELSDSLTDSTSAGSEPGGFALGQVVDLDSGNVVPFHVVGLSEEAYHVLCGLVQPSWMAAETPAEEALAVNTGGIYAECWDELRAKFPLANFRAYAAARGEDFYCEEAGF